MSDEVAIRRATWLFRQRGYTTWREDAIGAVVPLGRSRPDFLVETSARERLFVEAKAFEKESVLRTIKSRVFSLAHMSLQKRVNRLVADAAKQTLEYARYGFPIVIALDNWRQVGVHLDEESLTSLFGEAELQITIDPSTGAQVGSKQLVRKDDGSPLYDGKNKHVSAVVVVLPCQRFDTIERDDDFTIERPMKVRIIRNEDATHPLSAAVFNGADDVEY